MIEMRRGLIGIGLICSMISAGGWAPAMAQEVAQSDRQLLKFAAGDSKDVHGMALRATAAGSAVLLTSSELITVAVLDRALTTGKLTAHPGEALVLTIDGGKVSRFGFDAQRLAATSPPEWAGDAAPRLTALVAHQKRRRFWGLDEPAKVNASAPVAANVEAIRTSYLGNDTIVALRREAKGKPDVLAQLTVKRFAAALATRDAAAVADLIDPKPFTDTGASRATWQTARLNFAQKLTEDDGLVAAMAAEPAPVADGKAALDPANAYRIRLVPRDRAVFIAAVEPLS
jgi:hypothetical protein